MDKSKWFRIVYENGVLWVDGVKKRPGIPRDFVIGVIEAEIGKDVNTYGLYEMRNGIPRYHPEETGY